MGWFDDAHPGHEGYLVGFVRRVQSWVLWRELGVEDDSERVLLERLAVGCDCGWRSPHFHPPFGVLAHYQPHTVTLRPKVDNESGREIVWRAEEGVRAIWRQHVESCRRIQIHDACASLSDLVAGRSS